MAAAGTAAAFEVMESDEPLFSARRLELMDKLGVSPDKPGAMIVASAGALTVYRLGLEGADEESARALGEDLDSVQPGGTAAWSAQSPTVVRWSGAQSGLGRMKSEFKVDWRRLRSDWSLADDAPLVVVAQSPLKWDGAGKSQATTRSSQAWLIKASEADDQLRFGYALSPTGLGGVMAFMFLPLAFLPIGPPLIRWALRREKQGLSAISPEKAFLFAAMGALLLHGPVAIGLIGSREIMGPIQLWIGQGPVGSAILAPFLLSMGAYIAALIWALGPKRAFNTSAAAGSAKSRGLSDKAKIWMGCIVLGGMVLNGLGQWLSGPSREVSQGIQVTGMAMSLLGIPIGVLIFMRDKSKKEPRDP